MTPAESIVYQICEEIWPTANLPPAITVGPLLCGHCGTTEGVTLTVDPYARDIDGDESLYPMCSDCVNSRADDI